MPERTLQQRLGANVRRQRLRLGLSQEQLAHEIGLNRTYIGGIEQGRRNLSLQALERLADLLGVDPVALLSDES